VSADTIKPGAVQCSARAATGGPSIDPVASSERASSGLRKQAVANQNVLLFVAKSLPFTVPPLDSVIRDSTRRLVGLRGAGWQLRSRG
jgi:hypothetical protein